MIKCDIHKTGQASIKSKCPMLWHMACLQEAVTDFRELAYTLLSDKVTLIMSVKVEVPLSVSTPQEYDWYFTGERDTEKEPQ